MKMSVLKVTATVLLASVLGACGGGGSDAGLSLTDPYAVRTAYGNVLALARDVTLTGPGSDGDPYSVRFSLQPIASAVFPAGSSSTAVARTRQVLTLTNTRTRATATTTVDGYYDATTSTPIGSVDIDDGSCTRITAAGVLPATATVGASGALSTEADLSACTANATVTGTTTSTWSLESGNGFALLCENATIPASSTAPTATLSICVEVNANGSLGTRMRFHTKISTLPLFELTATNY